MNPSKYLQSRFVSGQVRLAQKKTTPMDHTEDSAVLAWLWVVVKIVTVYHFFLIFLHYVGVCLRVLPQPRDARAIAANAAIEAQKAKSMVDDILKEMDQSKKGHQHQNLDIKG